MSRQARPLRDWLLCRPVPPATTSRKGIIMPKDMDKDVVSEGVAEVIAAGPGIPDKKGNLVPLGVAPGDRVLYRGFLRYAQAVGDRLGCDKNTDRFLMSARDVLAVVEGSGVVGFYDEYRL